MHDPMPKQRLLLFSIAWLAVALLLACASVQAQSVPQAELRIRQIFVPESQLQTPLTQDRTGVVVDTAEFAQLVQAAQARRATQQGLPGLLSIRRADYRARLDGDRLLATLDVALDNATGTWGMATFQVGSWSIERAEFAATPGAAAAPPPLLVREGDARQLLQVFVTQPGEQMLTLELSLPLVAVGSDKEANFNLSGAPTGEFSLTLPAGKHLLLAGLELPRPTPVAEAATYTVPVGGLTSLSLRITDRQQTARADVLTFAATSYGVTVAPGQVTWVAQTALQVFGKPIDQLASTIPQDLEITSVESEGLEAWELADAAPGRTSLLLHYRQPFDGVRSMTLRGVVTAAAGAAWNVPDLVLNNVTSHVGTLVVSHPSGIRLQAVEARGVRAVTDLVVPAGFVAPGNQLQYQIWEENFSLSFATSAKQQEVRAALTNILDINEHWLDLYTTVNLEARFAPLFEVRIQLPVGWMVVHVAENNTAVNGWSVVPIETGQELRLELSQPLNPGESRELSLISMLQPAVWPVEDAAQTPSLPEVKLPQASMVEALYGVVADDAFAVVPVNLVGLDAARQADVNALNQRLTGITKQIRLGFSYQDSLFSGQLEVSRKPATITANTITFARLDPENLFVYLEGLVQLSGGGLRELQISVAESAGTDLRFQIPAEFMGQQGRASLGARIVEQSADPPTNGQRVWHLKLDRYLVGTVLLQAVIQMPREAGAAVVSIPNWRILNAEQQSGFIAVEASNDQRVQVTAQSAAGVPLPTVDPIDFPPARYQPVQRVVAGYQHVGPDWQVQVEAQRFDRLPMPTAIGQSLALTSIVNETGAVQNEATLQFQAVGVQSLLVKLPAEARLWATLLDNQPIEVRQTKQGYQVPLLSGETGATRSLKVVYESQSAPLTDMGEWQALPPTFAVLAGAGAEQPLEVLQQQWDLKIPQSVALFGNAGQFEPEARLDRGALFGMLTDLLQLPSLNRLKSFGLAFLLTALALLALRMCVQRFGWRTMLIAGTLGGLLIVVTWSLQRTGDLITMKYDAAPAVNSAAPQRPMSPGAMTPMTEESFGNLEMDYEQESAPAITSEPAIDPADLNTPDEFRSRSNAEMSLARSLESRAKDQVPQAASAPPSGGMPGVAGNGPISGPEGYLGQQGGSGAEMMGEAMELDSLSSMPSQSNGSGVGGGGFAPELPLFAGRAQAGALLSMTVGLEEPSDMRTLRFNYRGNGIEGVDLRLNYADLQAAQMLLLCVALSVVLIGWWLRTASWKVRCLWLLLTVALPWALAPVLPATWQMLAESLLCGGALSALLWCLYGFIRWLPNCCQWCCRNCCGWFSTRPTATPKRTQTGINVSLWLLILLALFAESHAQETSPPAVEREPYVIIPYAADADPLAARQVFIPHHLYQQLWLEAHPEEATDTLQVAPQIVEAHYAATLVGADKLAHIHVHARLMAVVPAATLKANGNPTVLLPFSAVSLSSVLVDGVAATVQPGMNQELLVPVPGAGPHVVDVTFNLPVQLTGPTGVFQLTLLPTSAARLEFTLPAIELVANVNSSSSTFRRVESEGITRIITPVDAGGTYEFTWRPRCAEAAVMGTLQVESATAVLVEDAGLSVNQSFLITPRQQTVNEFSFHLTTGAALRRITGADVGGWEINAVDGTTTLKVFLRRAVDTQTRIDIDLFQGLALTDVPQPVVVPLANPAGIASEAGLLGIFAGEQFALRGTPGEWITQINNAAFTPTASPTGLTGSPALAYRFVMRPFTLGLTLSRRPPAAVTNADHGVTVERRKLLVASRLDFNLTGAPRPSVSIALPEGYLPIDVSAAGMSDWYITQQEDRRILTVELAQPQLGQLAVYLEGRLPKTDGSAEIQMLLPAPVDVSRLTSTVAVWLDAGETGSVTSAGNWRALDPAATSAELRSLTQLPPQFAFRTTELELQPIALSVQRTAPEMQADAVTLIAATETTLDYGFTFRWRISRAAADTFQFTTPDWLAGRLDVNALGARQVLPTKLADGRMLWTVTLIEPVHDTYLLTAAATLPAPQDRRINTPVVQFYQGTADNLQQLEFQRHYAILVNLSATQIVPVDVNQIESASRDDLPLVVSEELVQQAMEIARVRVDRVPVWQMEQVTTQQAASASVIVADLATVVEADGSWRTRALYTVRNRGRQFLALMLPVNARLLSVVVKGEPARAVTTLIGTETAHLIALPQTSEADLSFEIKVILAGQLDRPLPAGMALNGVALELPVPQVVSSKVSAEYGLTVAQTLWNVYLPDDFTALPLHDVNRSNLTWHQERDAALTSELTRMEALRADITEMCRIAQDSTFTEAQRTQSKNNLKQLGLALHHYSESPSSSLSNGRATSWERQEIQQQNQQLYDELQRNLVELEDAPAPANFGEDGNGVLEGRGGRRFIELNNDSNYFANGGLGFEQAESSTPEFKFLPAQEAAKAVAGVKGRAVLKEQLQGQQIIRGNSLNSDYGGVAGQQMPPGNDSSGFGTGAVLDNRMQFRGRMDDVQQLPTRATILFTAPNAAPVDGVEFDDDLAANPQPQMPTGWTAAGGLSLDLEIPLNGRVYSFSKIGGDPRLTFQVQPREFSNYLRNGAWTTVWLVLGLWACHWLARWTSATAAIRIVAVVVLCGGLLGGLLLPTDLAVLSFVMAALGGLLLVVISPLTAAPHSGSPSP